MNRVPSIWIDLDNAPHAHFFAPLIRDLLTCGFHPLISVRSFGQTEGLAKRYGMKFTTIGSHKPHGSNAGRAVAALRRAGQLIEFGIAQRPVAAVSHGSRALTLAAAALGIPSMVLYDYEYVSSRVFHLLCDRVLVPEIVERTSMDPANLTAYPGFKEDVYVHDFVRDERILRDLNLDLQGLVVTVRPPATWAHYHADHSTTLFTALIEHLRACDDAQIVVLARTREQAHDLAKRFALDAPPFRLTWTAVDGLSLIGFSDAVFSGGGTMAREAALLGADAYSTFAGTPGAIDLELERVGKLTMLRSTDDIANILLRKRTRAPRPVQASTTRDFILRQILQLASKGQRPS